MTASSSSNEIGFIGLGIMGLGMAKNLLTKRNASLLVWNRDVGKSATLATEFPSQVRIASSPREVISNCNLVYSMLSTIEASQAVFDETNPEGVLAGIHQNSCIVDCATLTPERMSEMAIATTAKGGKFLEAPVSGSKAPAEQGTLIFMCSGSLPVYEMAGEDLDVMGKARHYLGEDIGAASRMKIVVNMVMGGMLTCFAEGLSLAKEANLPMDSLLSVIDAGAMSCPMFKGKGPGMVQGKYNTAFPLKHAQKDMRFAVELGDKLGQTLPVSAAANEVMKKARKKGHEDDDFSSVIEGL